MKGPPGLRSRARKPISSQVVQRPGVMNPRCLDAVGVAANDEATGDVDRSRAHALADFVNAALATARAFPVTISGV